MQGHAANGASCCGQSLRQARLGALMAEPSFIEIKNILNAFLPVYNDKRSTAFRLEHLKCENKSHSGKTSDLSCDCFIQDPNGLTLKLQLTRPPMEQADRSQIAKELKFHAAMKAAATELCLRGCLVICSYKALPRGKREIEQLARESMRGLASRWESRRRLGNAECDVRNLSELGRTSQRFIYSLKVRDLKLGDTAPLFMMEHYLGAFVPSAGIMVLEACLKKMKRYGNSGHDIVLVVHFDLDPYDNDEVSEMIARVNLETLGFQEIWAVSDLSSNAPKVHCLVPKE